MKPTQLDIYLRLSQHRQIGNTLFNITGINYDRPAVILFATHADAAHAYDSALRYIELSGPIDPRLIKRGDLILGKVRFKTISLLSEKHYSSIWGLPISIDHFALRLLIEDDRKARFEEWTKSKH